MKEQDINCEVFDIMISEYMDNELPKEREASLFAHISVCENCRHEFKQQNMIKYEISKNKEAFPEELEQRIFSSIKERAPQPLYNRFNKPISVFVSYGMAVILVVIIMFSFWQIQKMRTEVGTLREAYRVSYERVQTQTREMNLIMNNMPAYRVGGQAETY